MSVIRLDRLQSGGLRRLDNGYVRVAVTATRAGIFVYRGADGSEWRELRPTEEVFKADSMSTLAGVPVTNEHPSGLLDSRNTKSHAVGFTSEQVERSDIYLKTAITLTDQETIDAMEAGKREVSCGYSCDVVKTPGVWRGQRYDAIQKNIRYNHLAIVAKGRAGEEVRVHMDSQDMVMRLDSFIEADDKKPNGGKVTMKTLLLDGVEYSIQPDMYEALTARFKKDHDAVTSLKEQLSAVTADKEKIAARADSLADENKALAEKATKQDSAADAEVFAARVRARVKLEAFAAPRLDSETDISAMSDRDIIIALVKKLNPEFTGEGKSDEYINSRADSLFENPSLIKTREDAANKTTNKGLDALKQTASQSVKADASEKPLNYHQARRASMERAASAYQKPIGLSLSAK